MSMTDPIADMLTRIRNAQTARHSFTEMPTSNMKESIARILAEEGYISGYSLLDTPPDGPPRKVLHIDVKYRTPSQGVISNVSRVSRPGRRVYRNVKELPRVRGGLGIAIVSTSQGLLTDHQARKAGIGGEVLCELW